MDSEHIDPATGEVKAGPFFRTGFNYDSDQVSLETSLECKDPSLTQQQFRDDADINVLAERYGLTGRMPENPRVPTYGDYTGVTDYRSAIEAARAAEASFMELPGPVRAEFDNDPQTFLEAFSYPQNEPRLRELGFFKPSPVQAPSPGPSQEASPSPAPAKGAKASADPGANSSTP